jgi:hypothetical protein
MATAQTGVRAIEVAGKQSAGAASQNVVKLRQIESMPKRSNEGSNELPYQSLFLTLGDLATQREVYFEAAPVTSQVGEYSAHVDEAESLIKIATAASYGVLRHLRCSSDRKWTENSKDDDMAETTLPLDEVIANLSAAFETELMPAGKN